jgi:hypothetical protein
MIHDKNDIDYNVGKTFYYDGYMYDLNVSAKYQFSHPWPQFIYDISNTGIMVGDTIDGEKTYYPAPIICRFNNCKILQQFNQTNIIILVRINCS